MFDEFSVHLKKQFPGMAVEGDNYPPHPARQMVASFLSFAKILLIIGVVMVEKVVQSLNFDVNAYPIVAWCQENKVRCSRGRNCADRAVFASQGVVFLGTFCETNTLESYLKEMVLIDSVFGPNCPKSGAQRGNSVAFEQSPVDLNNVQVLL